MSRQLGLTVIETAIGGAVLVAGTVGIMTLVQQGLQLSDPQNPTSAYYVPMVESLLRNQVESIKAYSLPVPPNSSGPFNGTIAQQQEVWTPPIRVNGYWFFTQASLDASSSLANQVQLQRWTVKVFAYQTASSTLDFTSCNNPNYTTMVGCPLLAQTQFWRLIKYDGLDPISM